MEDAPGSKPDPVEKRQTTTDFDDFISALSDSSIDPDRDEMTTVFNDAGFKSAGLDARFFGETHSPETSVHVFSSFIEVGSEDGATSALDWLETDQMKPCPMSCAVQRSSFKVDDIPDARGVHRVATAEDIEARGTQDERPQDDYWIGFTTVQSSTRWFSTATRCQEPFRRTKLSRSRARTTTVSQPASGPR